MPLFVLGLVPMSLQEVIFAKIVIYLFLRNLLCITLSKCCLNVTITEYCLKPTSCNVQNSLFCADSVFSYLLKLVCKD